VAAVDRWARRSGLTVVEESFRPVYQVRLVMLHENGLRMLEDVGKTFAGPGYSAYRAAVNPARYVNDV
jgi:hypothetical protein